ncbi:MAG: hypothetical protein Q8P13_02670 [bacterium]|nr:hypothetical protein [bacterium]
MKTLLQALLIIGSVWYVIGKFWGDPPFRPSGPSPNPKRKSPTETAAEPGAANTVWQPEQHL